MVNSKNKPVNGTVNGKEGMPLTNSTEIIDRMKEAAGTTTDVELAEILGKHKQNVTHAKKRGVPLAWVLTVSQQYYHSLDWLIYGEEPKKRADRLAEGGERPPIDIKLLENIVAALEKGLDDRDLMLDPDKKAQAVSLLYELYADTQKEVTEETVVRYLKLVA